MASKALRFNATTMRNEITADLVEASEAVTLPTAYRIPRANSDGEIAAGWVPVAARTITVQTVSGVPALTDIATLVVGDGDLTFLGGGAARIRTASDATGSGGGAGSVTIAEVDGSPDITGVTRIVVGTGDLIDNGSGTVRLRTASDATGGGSGDGTDLGTVLALFERCW